MKKIIESLKTFLLLLKSNIKTILQIALALFFIAMSLFFLRHEQAELGHVQTAISMASPIWLIVGLGLSFFYVFVMAFMYQNSFKAIDQKIGLFTGVILFLKKNLVSLFLPAGVLTNLAFFNEEVKQRENINKTQIYFASSIFTICSIVSTLIVGIPVLLWLLTKNLAGNQHVLGLVATLSTLLLLGLIIRNILKEGYLYKLAEVRFPVVVTQLKTFQEQEFKINHICKVLLWSVVIEIIGIVHLYISMKAITGIASLEASVLAYTLVLLILMSSPFLRGIGAIEITMVVLLKSFNFSEADSISITFLFRFFEFWIILIFGIMAFLVKKDNIVLRLFPAVLIFVLGVVNILSALTPAIPERLTILREFLPIDTIHGSSYLVIFTGLMMFICAVYLIKGFKVAWWIALLLSTFSLFGHLAKGIDYEEAGLALLTLTVLVFQRKHYFRKSDPKIHANFWLPAVVAFLAVFTFGTLGFFLLDGTHFHKNFTLFQSFEAMTKSFFMLDNNLLPLTAFGHQFMISINILGISIFGYILFVIFRPYIFSETDHTDQLKAKAFIDEYGSGNLDYFKGYFDKKFWFNESENALFSFKNTSNYAIALENPVIIDKADLALAIEEFDGYCLTNNLRSAYYRVPEEDIETYTKMGKKVLPIGQEAFIDLNTFSLQGGSMKAFRNTMNKVDKLGFKFVKNLAPQKESFLQQLKSVSNDWLHANERDELGFAKGVFVESELKNQTILSVQNEEGKVVAFVNIIPDFEKGEGNFDLMRKTHDAPASSMDFLLVNMLQYLKENGFQKCTLGLVPMSGIENPKNIQEQVIKIAYEKLKLFSNYKSLWFYKEKFNPEWKMRYLVYDASFDLIFLPTALERIMKI